MIGKMTYGVNYEDVLHSVGVKKFEEEWLI